MNTILTERELRRKVSAVIVTRGDCDLSAIVRSLPFEDIVIWDNSRRPENVKVFGRFRAIQEARNDLIYTQDDDCIVQATQLLPHYEDGMIVTNVPRRWQEFYTDGVTLIGWGALFHRRLVDQFDRYLASWPQDDLFQRECDRVFTALNRTKCVEVPFRSLVSASAPGRMCVERRHSEDLAEIRRRIERVLGRPLQDPTAPSIASRAKRVLKNILQASGYKLVRTGAAGPGQDDGVGYTPDEWATYDATKPYTISSVASVMALIKAVKYLGDYSIPGDIVECGFRRDGNVIAIARTLAALGQTGRKIYLCDTLAESPAAPVTDRNHMNRSAAMLMASERASTASILAYPDIEEVRRNVANTGYPGKNVILFKGRAEEAISASMPERISLLCLNASGYESTKCALEYLYSRLIANGVLLIDDYGRCQGCREAIDEYFGRHASPVFLQRVDYTARLAIKSSS